ncbi:MAG: pantoate--beta-alanine ligase [Bacteroidota bacterium]
MTQEITAVSALAAYIHEVKSRGQTVGFIPTMGALHEGHLTIVRKARKENNITVVSIYVNERQFNNPEDFLKYPRNDQRDFTLLQGEGVDAVYFPQTAELFTQENLPVRFSMNGLDELLEGASRPGHFKGVVEVVHALFKHVQPTRAYFGLKDFQQVAVLQKMVKALELPVDLVAVPTVREENGLALSSRNQRLSKKQQQEALILFKTLCFLKDHYQKRPLNELLAQAKANIHQSSLKLDYLEIVDPETLISLQEQQPRALACVAAFCGEVRLIDNMLLIAQ